LVDSGAPTTGEGTAAPKVALPTRAESGPVLTSLVSLVLAIVGNAAIAIHTCVNRRFYQPFYEAGLLAPSPLLDFILLTPAPLYVASFVLLAMGLLVKELAFERKGLTLRINLAAFAFAFVLYMTWIWSIEAPGDTFRRIR
jgi:hypothetical protein